MTSAKFDPEMPYHAMGARIHDAKGAVTAAAEWGKSLRALTDAGSLTPSLGAAEQPTTMLDGVLARPGRVRAPGGAVIVGARPRAPSSPACACPGDDACDFFQFDGAMSSWSLASLPPASFNGQSFTGWRDVRKIDTRDPSSGTQGTLDFRMAWSLTAARAGLFALGGPMFPCLLSIEGAITKDPARIWEAGRVVVEVFLWVWIVNPTQPVLPVATAVKHFVAIDTMCAWFDGPKHLQWQGNIWSPGLPKVIFDLTAPGSTVHIRSEVEIRWIALGGADLGFIVDELAVPSPRMSEVFRLCE